MIVSRPPSTATRPPFVSRVPPVKVQPRLHRARPLQAARSGALQGPLKSELLQLVAPTEFGYASTPALDKKIAQLIETLEGSVAAPQPFDNLAPLCRSWRLVYSNLPGMYAKLLPFTQVSRGIGLDVLSFFALPQIPVQLEKVHQVVRANGTYSLIQEFSAEETLHGQLAVRGTFTADKKRPSRLRVEFNQLGLTYSGKSDELAKWNTALGTELSATQRCINFAKPMSNWSDVSYLDQDLRVARAGFGGLYLMVAEDDQFGETAEVNPVADATCTGFLAQRALKLMGGRLLGRQ
jgi:hypothetical protein